MNQANVTLGISDSHDAGVAVLVDGRLAAAINEERLSRKKMAAGMPLRALEAIWKVAGVRPEDVDSVGVAGRSTAGAAMPMNNDFSNDEGRHLLSQKAAELIDRLPGGRALMASDAALHSYRSIMPYRTRGRVDAIRQALEAIGVRAPAQ